MTSMKLINANHQFTAEEIVKVNVEKNAKWVADMEYKGKLMSVFYQAEPAEGHSNYFALFWAWDYLDPKHGPMNTRLMITDGAWIEEAEITGIEADNGDVIYSHYRHHYHTSEDGSVFIDGGREYTRCNKPGRLRKIVVEEGTIKLS